MFAKRFEEKPRRNLREGREVFNEKGREILFSQIQ
jgi:hypothetical protein